MNSETISQNRKNSLPILLEFIVFLCAIELIFFLIFKSIGFHLFQMSPYLRLVTIIFSFLYLLKKDFIRIGKLFKINIKSTVENYLILTWLFFTIVGFIIGIFNQNPIIYLFTDTIYIFYGYFLFRVFGSNDEIQNQIRLELTNTQERYFVIWVIVLSIFTVVFGLTMPPFFIVFCLAFSLHLLNKKKHWFSLLLITPFFIQLLSSNRATLIVFLIVIAFYFLQNKFNRKNIFTFFYLFFFLSILSYFFIDDFLSLIISILPPSSDIHFRINQINEIIIGHFNWNAPEFLSIKQRFDEAEIVIDYWLSNPMNFIFGGGMGATISGFSLKDAGVIDAALLGESNIHNIHLLPFSLILRHGIFGIIIFFLLLYNIVIYLFKILLNKSSIIITLTIFVFCWFFYSLSSSGFLWTSPLFWVALSYISNGKRK